MTEDSEELIKCPSCSKKFFISTFKINRLGQRLRTCLSCLDRQKEERKKQNCVHGKTQFGRYCKSCLAKKEETHKIQLKKHIEEALLKLIKKQTKKTINTQIGALNHLECTISQFREYIEKQFKREDQPCIDGDVLYPEMSWDNFTITPAKHWNQNNSTPASIQKNEMDYYA